MIDFSEFALATFVIIGLVNGIGFAVDRNWKSFIYFITALVAGLVFGFLKWFGLPSAEIGLGVAIASSGVYKVAQKISGQ
jgi:hypothetical protein